MNESVPQSDDRMLQLLADRATEGLESAEAATLNQWLATDPDVDTDSFDRAAAVVALSRVAWSDASLPVSLRNKLFADAEAFFAGSDIS